MDKNYFEVLNSINVNDKIEKKNGLSYLSWPYAWGELKKRDPLANYKIYENGEGWNYHTDGRTCWVKVSVIVNGIEHIEHLPVMDFRNQSIPLAKVTSFDVNKTIQRALTKAAARHGLGLYIYAGEDLPDEACEPCAEPPKEKTTKKVSKPVEAKSAPKKVSPDEDPARVELREFIQLNNLNGALIAQMCGLGPQSTSQDYMDALAYAKTMVGG